MFWLPRPHSSPSRPQTVTVNHVCHQTDTTNNPVAPFIKLRANKNGQLGTSSDFDSSGMNVAFLVLHSLQKKSAKT